MYILNRWDPKGWQAIKNRTPSFDSVSSHLPDHFRTEKSKSFSKPTNLSRKLSPVISIYKKDKKRRVIELGRRRAKLTPDLKPIHLTMRGILNTASYLLKENEVYTINPLATR